MARSASILMALKVILSSAALTAGDEIDFAKSFTDSFLTKILPDTLSRLKVCSTALSAKASLIMLPLLLFIPAKSLFTVCFTESSVDWALLEKTMTSNRISKKELLVMVKHLLVTQ